MSTIEPTDKPAESASANQQQEIIPQQEERATGNGTAETSTVLEPTKYTTTKDDPTDIIISLNPAHRFFRNQLFADQITDLSDLESSQRLFIIRKYHSGFVDIADRVMTHLQMSAIKGGIVKTVSSMVYSASPLRSPRSASGSASPTRRGVHSNGSFYVKNTRNIPTQNVNVQNSSFTGSFAIDDVNSSPTNRSELISRQRRLQMQKEAALREDEEYDEYANDDRYGAIGETSVGGSIRGQSKIPTDTSARGVNASAFYDDVNGSHYYDLLASIRSPFAKGGGDVVDGIMGGASSTSAFVNPNNNTLGGKLTSNSLRNDSFSVSTLISQNAQNFAASTTNPAAARHYHAEHPANFSGTDVAAATIRRKDAKLRAMAVAFDEEKRRADAFKLNEQKRTEAARRKQLFEKDEQLYRSQKQNINTHTSYIQLQKTKEEVSLREQVRNREKAIESRKEMIELQRRAKQETHRRMTILAHQTLEEAKNEYNYASASLKNSAAKTSNDESVKRSQKSQAMKNFVHRTMKIEKDIEFELAHHNAREADHMERRQHISHGLRDAEGVVRPYQLAAATVGFVSGLPIEEVLDRPHFSPRKGVCEASDIMAAASSISARNSSTLLNATNSSNKSTRGKSPINPLTYHRLCGGNGRSNFSPAAVFEEAYGKGKLMTDMDSYYMLRGPQDVNWKR